MVVVVVLMLTTMTMTMLLMMLLTVVPMIATEKVVAMVVNRWFSTRGSVPPLLCPSQYVPEPQDGRETPSVCYDMVLMVVVGRQQMNTNTSNICSSVLVRGSQIISILSVKWGRGKMKRGKGCGGEGE